MNSSDPPIIKSGAHHSVQVAQGTRNAKSVRNVVHAEEQTPSEDRIVVAQEGTMRDAPVLQGAQNEEPMGHAADRAWQESEHLKDSLAQAPEAEGAAGPHRELAPEEQAGQAAAQGPVVLQQELASQDAHAAKQGLASENLIQVTEDGAPDGTRGPIVEAAAAIDHREKIEQIQASANRIRLDVQQQSSPDPVHQQAGERVLRDHEVSAADSAASSAAPSVEEPMASGPAPAVESELPPEVAANLGLGSTAAPAARESDLMARLRAIKTNMSVTQDRLSKLQPNTPPRK
jgi:hypothetical protein